MASENLSARVRAARQNLDANDLASQAEALKELGNILQEDPGNAEAIGALTRVLNNTQRYDGGLEKRARRILKVAAEKGSSYAAQVLENPQEMGLYAEAEGAYYAEEYERAHTLLEKMSPSASKHPKVRELKAKVSARLQSAPVSRTEEDDEVPREAKQYYRRARSYIGAREYQRAADILETAVEIAEEAGVRFRVAEEALEELQERLIEQELHDEAMKALQSGDIADALRKLENYQAQRKDPQAARLEKAVRAVQAAYWAYKNAPRSPETLEKMSEALKLAVEWPDLMNVPFYRELQEEIAPLRKRLAAELWKQAQIAYDDAEKAKSLGEKKRLYREAADAAESILRLGEPSEDVIRLKNRANDRYERLVHVVNHLKKVREGGSYPHGVPEDILEELRVLAPESPETRAVESAREEICEQEKTKADTPPDWLISVWFLLAIGGGIAAVALTTNIPVGFVPAIFLVGIAITILLVKGVVAIVQEMWATVKK